MINIIVIGYGLQLHPVFINKQIHTGAMKHGMPSQIIENMVIKETSSST